MTARRAGRTPDGAARRTPADVPLLGVDFTSRPSRAKPIVVATGVASDGGVDVLSLERFATLEGFVARLGALPAFVGAFDLPFGPPREFAEWMGWPDTHRDFARVYAETPREALRERFKSFCAARPPGAKFAHRATDLVARSSPSMKWVNPPVAFMMHAGLPALIASGAHFPAHEEPPSRPARVALEGYPALLAREFVGSDSYKSDGSDRDDPVRRARRVRIVAGLAAGAQSLGLSLRMRSALSRRIVGDGRADDLDAVLCLAQAAWARQRPGYGIPPGTDRLEGWIVTAAPPKG